MSGEHRHEAWHDRTGRYVREGAAAGADAAQRKLGWRDVLVFTVAGLLLGMAGFLVSLLFTGCGGQAESAQAEALPEEPAAQADPDDRWCCIRFFPWNGEPYAECGLWGDSIPSDAVDCACDAYLASCEGE